MAGGGPSALSVWNVTGRPRPSPLLGVKRTFLQVTSMSAFDPCGHWPAAQLKCPIEEEATIPIGQAPQALVCPDAAPAVGGALNAAMTRMPVAPKGLGTSNLQPLGLAGQSARPWLAPPGANKEANAPTSVSLSDQGLVQVLEAAVTDSSRESHICLRLRVRHRALALWNHFKVS